jgi:hypothetical protein
MGNLTWEGLRDLDKDPDDSWTISFGGLSGRKSKTTARPDSPAGPPQAAGVQASQQASDPWKGRWEREHGPTPPEPGFEEDHNYYPPNPKDRKRWAPPTGE